MKKVTWISAVLVVFVGLAAPYVYWTLIAGVHNVVYFALLSALTLFVVYRGPRSSWIWIALIALGFSVPVMVVVQVVNGEYVLVAYEHGIRNWFVTYWSHTSLLFAYNLLLLAVLKRLFRDIRGTTTKSLEQSSQ